MISLGGMRGFSLGLLLAAAAPLGAAELNDYPTAARADYVFACMKTNGETRQALEQCSCSISVIASFFPDGCVSAETRLQPLVGAGPLRHVQVPGAGARRHHRAAPRAGGGARPLLLNRRFASMRMTTCT
jgi:hypothetical protein